MACSPNALKLTAIGTTFAYMFLLGLMMGLNYYADVNFGYGFRGYGLYFSMGFTHANVILFVIYVLFLLVIAVTVAGMMLDNKIVLLVNAVMCICGVMFLLVSFIMFCVNHSGWAKYWFFWRGLIMHIFVMAFLVITAVVDFLIFRSH
ncbi:hypothetical protein L596_028704 [Steinernema carpocapsae]|uniref:Uncharacterized protein n=1 Tax=Steinernema carpocapsae TaxID=34508 RepID=A0A4U5M072_STECR|nr:hypothetical protein L596_028704 [Steinernema carpocapsae]